MKVKIVLSILFLVGFILTTNNKANINYRNNYSEIKASLKTKKTVKKEAFTKQEKQEYELGISSILKKYRFNGTVLVVKNGDIIFKKAQGFSNLKTKDSLRENSVFQLASVSKQFTAMAIMILKERDKLDYNDLVTKHIPEFPYKNITIKHLLSHTSGLQNYIWLVEHYWTNKKSITNEDVLKLYLEHTLPLNFAPGNRFIYCNTGYVFLALIVERISKQNFSDFVKINIFDKANMTNTFVYKREIMDTIRNRAMSFNIGRRTYRQIEDDLEDEIHGDKGIFSSIEDLYKWDQSLYNNILVSQYTINDAFQSTVLNNNKTREYGFGWRIRDFNGKKVIYHNGWWHGYKTSITRFVDDKNTIIVLNNTNSHIRPLLNDIQNFIYSQCDSENIKETDTIKDKESEEENY